MPSFWLKLLAYGWLVALFFNKECPLQILVPKEAYMHGSDLYLCGLFSVWFLCLLRTCTRNAHTGRCQLACNSVMLMCPAVSISAYVPNYQLSESVKLLCISRLSNRCQNRSLTLCLLETGLFIHWASCNVSCWKLLVHINFFFCCVLWCIATMHRDGITLLSPNPHDLDQMAPSTHS